MAWDELDKFDKPPLNLSTTISLSGTVLFFELLPGDMILLETTKEKLSHFRQMMAYCF